VVWDEGGLSWCFRATTGDVDVWTTVGEGTLPTSVKLSETTAGEPGSELLFVNNPLLTDFGDVLGDFSTMLLFRPLALEATDSNFETSAWFRSSGEGEGDPWREFLGEWWGEFLADPLKDVP
jgi:hypothetical protein